MAERPGVLLDFSFEREGKLEAFRAALPGREIVAAWDGAPEPSQRHGLAYAVVWNPEPGSLAAMPDLRVVFSLGAGVDHVVGDPTLPDVPLVRFVDPDLTGRMVEWVVLQALTHLRRAPAYAAAQAKRQWRELEAPPAREMRVGIMGMGELGRACVAPLGTLGFPVAGWSRSGRMRGGSVEGVEMFDAAGLDAFLARTDMLVCLLPLTDETRGLIDASLIDRLATDGPFGAPIIVNAGRGGSQVEADLVAALADGRLHAASLDVFEREPLPADSPLWARPDVVVTPHMAAVSTGRALAGHVARQIERFEAGEPLEHVVDRARGY